MSDTCAEEMVPLKPESWPERGGSAGGIRPGARTLLVGNSSRLLCDCGSLYSIPPVEGDPGWRLLQSFDGIKVYERTPGLINEIGDDL